MKQRLILQAHVDALHESSYLRQGPDKLCHSDAKRSFRNRPTDFADAGDIEAVPTATSLECLKTSIDMDTLTSGSVETNGTTARRCASTKPRYSIFDLHSVPHSSDLMILDDSLQLFDRFTQ